MIEKVENREHCYKAEGGEFLEIYAVFHGRIAGKRQKLIFILPQLGALNLKTRQAQEQGKRKLKCRRPGYFARYNYVHRPQYLQFEGFKGLSPLGQHQPCDHFKYDKLEVEPR